MSHAPETGYYFEPLTERLVLVLEGSAFPSDDQWAWIGDPIEMTQDEARLHVALRWPGIDPEELVVEFDLDFQRAAEAAELQRLETLAGVARVPREFDLDVEQLLSQAELLREAARQITLHQTSPGELERATELRMAQQLAAQLAEPSAPGRPIAVTPAASTDAAAPEGTPEEPGPERE